MRKVLKFSFLLFNVLFSCILNAQIMPYQYGFSNPLSNNNNLENAIGDPIILLDGAYASQLKWFDTSAFGNDFSLLGLPETFSSYKGIVRFDGVNDYGQLDNNLSTSFSNGITILAFVKFDSNRFWERILDFGEGEADDNIIFSREGTTNNLWFEIRHGEDQPLTSSLGDGIINGQWGFYGARLDGTNYKLFNQNKMISGGSNVLPQTVDRDSNFIGDSNWTGDAFFEGDMGVIAVYDRALTDSQINSFYDYYRVRYNLSWYLKNCKEIKDAFPDATSGIYKIDYNGYDTSGGEIDCYCDMETEGGGWTLVLNYLHEGVTNPDPNPDLLVKTTSLPLLGSTTLGTDESSSTTLWGHASNSLMNSLNFTEVRFFGKTSKHNRVIHFKTSHDNTISYFKTGTGSMAGINANFTPLDVQGETAFLPGRTANYFADEGDYAMTNFPFWLTGTYHWGIRGLGSRWEVDDYPNNSSYNTHHQIWIR